jgi:hypothetical protein
LALYLNEVISASNKIQQATALQNIITIYNTMIKGTDLMVIKIPEQIRNLLQPETINILNSTPEIINTIICNFHNLHKTDLTLLSKTQLSDILIYIDSLRNSDGMTDTKFIGLQNEITHELSTRRNETKIT